MPVMRRVASAPAVCVANPVPAVVEDADDADGEGAHPRNHTIGACNSPVASPCAYKTLGDMHYNMRQMELVTHPMVRVSQMGEKIYASLHYFPEPVARFGARCHEFKT